MRLRHVLLGVAAFIIVIPAAALAVFLVEFDPNAYAPSIIAAVDQATGRQLAFGGPIQLRLSLTPTVQVSGVSLSNPPGFADPNLLTLNNVQAQIPLLPLLAHKVDIRKLVLASPVITLETDKTGRSGWDLTPPGTPAAPPAASSSYQVAIESVEIQNGLLTIKGAQPGQNTSLAITDLTGKADSTSAPLNIQAQAAYNGTPFTLSGAVGPVERFSGIGSGPWPVNLTLNTAGANAMVNGTISQPRLGKGYDLTVNASVPALEALGSVLPAELLKGVALPPVHGITASARIVDQNSTIPAIDNLSIKAGASDLGSFRPGLVLTSLDVEMASLDKPITINAAGTINNAPLTLAGNFGPPQALFNPVMLPASMPPQGSYPVDLQVTDGPAKIGINGAIATPTKLAGVALSVNAAIPDLSALTPLAGTPLPKWTNIALQTTVIDPGGLGLMKAVGVDSLVFSMDHAAFGGDASLYFGAQPRLQAALSGQQIDLDALLAAIPPPPPPTATAPVAPAPAPAPTTATPATPATLATPAETFVIPDTALPLAMLKTDSADIQLSANTVIFNKATYSAIQGHAVLANGVLTINPLTGELPGGSVSATASLDATKEPAAASISLNAPALALSPFLKAFNLPDPAQGTIQESLNASGTGDSLHQLASTMNGQLGLASVNGIIDGSVLDKVFGAALRTVGLPEKLVGAQGPVSVRCFGLRVDVANGVGTVRALTLDSSRLLMQGGGTMNFGTETLAIVLRPQMQVIGNQVGVPVEIGGTFANPTTSVAPFGALQEAAKTAVGLPVSLAQDVVGGGGFLGKVAGKLGFGSAGDVCPTALDLGRLGQPGPAAPPPAAPQAGMLAPVTRGPKNLLNSLFGN